MGEGRAGDNVAMAVGKLIGGQARSERQRLENDGVIAARVRGFTLRHKAAVPGTW